MNRDNLSKIIFPVIIFTIYGARTKHLLFPLLILAFMVPLPPFLNRILTFKLKMIASAVSVDMLRQGEL